MKILPADDCGGCAALAAGLGAAGRGGLGGLTGFPSACPAGADAEEDVDDEETVASELDFAGVGALGAAGGGGLTLRAAAESGVDEAGGDFALIEMGGTFSVSFATGCCDTGVVCCGLDCGGVGAGVRGGGCCGVVFGSGGVRGRSGNGDSSSSSMVGNWTFLLGWVTCLSSDCSFNGGVAGLGSAETQRQLRQLNTHSLLFSVPSSGPNVAANPSSMSVRSLNAAVYLTGRCVMVGFLTVTPSSKILFDK